MRFLLGWSVPLVIALGAIGCAIAVQRAAAALHSFCVEDALFEWLSALFFVVAAVGFVGATFGSRLPAGTPRSGIWLLLAASGIAIVFAGGEISWGQRLLGFETPEPIKAVNQQGEFNVHNVGELHRLKYSLLVASIAAGGCGLPLLCRLVPGGFAAGWSRRLGVPLPAWPDIVGFAIALIVLRHFANWLPFHERNDAQEFGEMLFSLAVMGCGLRGARGPEALFLEVDACRRA